MTGILNILAGALGVAKDTYFNLVSLLLPGNGTNGAQNNTFLDGSTNNFTITRNGNTTQGTFSPFSQTGWGNYFDGSGDYLTAADNAAFDVGSGDWTIELWANFNSVSGEKGLVSHFTAGTPNAGYTLRLSTSNSPSGLRLVCSGSSDVVLQAAWTPVVGTWYHIAAVRNGGTLYIYVDGQQIGSTSIAITIGNPSALFAVGTAQTVASSDFNGYISNVRVVKGVAVYTGAFTPPILPLAATQSAGTNIAAITGTQTSLLTCQSNRFIDNSSNAFAITANGNPSVVAFSPFAPTAAYTTAAVGGSGYFDGTGDYLTLAPGASFAFGTGDFTVECWLYAPSAPSGTGSYYSLDARNSGQTTNWAFGTNLTGSSSTMRIDWYTGSAVLQGSNAITGAWNHCVYTRTGTTYGLFVNGTRAATGTDSTNYNVSPTTSYIGSGHAGGPLNGYLSSVRVVKGTAVYDPTQSSITVPTAPLTAIANTSLLLNFTNAGITDATAKNDLETVGNAQISTSVSKFGGGSIAFDGTGDWLQLPASDIYAFGSGDYTVEAWVYFTSINNTTLQIIFMSGSTGGNSFYFHVDGNQISVGTSAAFISNQVATFTTGLWYHIAACRSGTTLRLFVNGTQAGSNATDTTNWTSSGNARIGANETGGQTVFGYIDDLRITKGYARYTANFTVPAAPFPVQ